MTDRRGASDDFDAAVAMDLGASDAERAESALLDEVAEAEAGKFTTRPAGGVVGANGSMVESRQKSIEQAGEVGRIVNHFGPERVDAAVERHPVV